MTLELIYVTRHGFRSNWLVDPATGDYTATVRSPTGISADPALTAHGVDQAKELGAHLLQLQPPVEAVYSSPYYRCLQTVEPFVRQRQAGRQQAKTDDHDRPVQGEAQEAEGPKQPEELALYVRCETGLSEWYGSAPFEHPTPAPQSTLARLFPRMLDESYYPQLSPSRTGETMAELHDRVATAVDLIIKQCDQEGRRAVLLCSHAAVVIALGRVLTGEVPEDAEAEDFRAFTCGLSAYRRRKEPTGASTSANLGNGPKERQKQGPALVQQQQQQELQLQQPREIDSGQVPGNVEPRGETLAATPGDQSGADHHLLPWNTSESGQNAVKWRGGRGVGFGWDSVLNSDCSFLSGGEERGWRFSGEESFPGTASRADGDAGLQLGVVVEGDTAGKRRHKATDNSRL